MRDGGPAPAVGLQEPVPELWLQLSAGRLLRLTNAECGVRNAEWRTRMSWLDPPPDIPHSAFRIPHSLMSHLLALALLGVDCVARAWRIQLATWTAGGRLSFRHAFRLNLYGEAASQLTPHRLGGEPARFLGLTEAGRRPVTAIVAIGVEGACEWPGVLFAGAGAVAPSRAELGGAARTQRCPPPAGGRSPRAG